jgi:hypothetical protein
MRNLRIFLLLTCCLTAGTISAEVANWLAAGGNATTPSQMSANSLGGTHGETAAQAELSAEESQQVRASES